MIIDGEAVRITEEDQCDNCQNYMGGVTCPLLQALGFGVATLTSEYDVTDCSFYKEFKRELRIVK